MMPYWLYKTIYILCNPVRWVLYFVPFMRNPTNQEFCVWLLFRNRYKALWVLSQMRMETDNFSSNLYVQTYNPAMMGMIKRGTLQTGYKWTPYYLGIGITKPTPSGNQFTIYRNISDGIYSYYYTCYQDFMGIGKALDNTPSVDLQVGKGFFGKPTFNNEAYIYGATIAGTFKAYNWNPAPASDYYSRVQSRFDDFRDNWANCYLVYGCTLWVWYSAFKVIQMVGKAFGITKAAIQKKLGGTSVEYDTGGTTRVIKSVESDKGTTEHFETRRRKPSVRVRS